MIGKLTYLFIQFSKISKNNWDIFLSNIRTLLADFTSFLVNVIKFFVKIFQVKCCQCSEAFLGLLCIFTIFSIELIKFIKSGDLILDFWVIIFFYQRFFQFSFFVLLVYNSLLFINDCVSLSIKSLNFIFLIYFFIL